MNGQIRAKGRFIWASPLEATNTDVKMHQSLINIPLYSLWAFILSKEISMCYKTCCNLVAVASSAFTTNSVWEEWKALIVSPYPTQWLLNGLKPINLAVTRGIAAGSVTNVHKRQEPSAEQSLPTNWFWDAYQTKAMSFKTYTVPPCDTNSRETRQLWAARHEQTHNFLYSSRKWQKSPQMHEWYAAHVQYPWTQTKLRWNI